MYVSFFKKYKIKYDNFVKFFFCKIIGNTIIITIIKTILFL